MLSDLSDLSVQLKALAEMSNKYGADPDYVLAGGGNTSFKTSDTLFIKGSGTSLASITSEEFVAMDRAKLADMWTAIYPDDEKDREAAVLFDMMSARKHSETRRPSVETLLHDLFSQQYVLHVHPAVVNGLTCSVNGESAMKQLFPKAVWISLCKPGYLLALECKAKIADYIKLNGVCPNLIFLQNHGVFFASDTIDGLDILAEDVMSVLKAQIKREPDFSEPELSPETIDKATVIAPALRMLYGEGKNPSTVKFIRNKEILNYDPSIKSFSPDHIVYYKAKILILNDNSDNSDIKSAFDTFVSDNGYKPKIVYVKNLGAFACGDSFKEASTAASVFLDAVKITVYSESFGGYLTLTDDFIDFIVNWEVESYRSKISFDGVKKFRLANKVALITGAAQGFGKGIAEQLSSEGAYIIIADMNYDGAKATADTIPNSFAVSVNVTDEASVKAMIDSTVLTYGGLDILVNNAGVVKAGSLDEMQKSAFEFVASVNYTGYFLCVKYASKAMKIQHLYAPDYMMDIIEINSKSGLSGSNKNFAYAGSKFGGIGLTQSFALELVEFNIKVNAVCPGNFLNGPLWSDPEKGLFVQYLKAGKVPGAKTVDDVRKAYESKVPLKRGCEIMDVVRAIYYIIEQEYETGQAVPVTGGQEMLK